MHIQPWIEPLRWHFFMNYFTTFRVTVFSMPVHLPKELPHPVKLILHVVDKGCVFNPPPRCLYLGYVWLPKKWIYYALALWCLTCVVVMISPRGLYNEPTKRKRLSRSGIFMVQWFRRWTLESATQVRSRMVRYTGGSGNPGSPVSGSSPAWLQVARARGSDLKKGGVMWWTSQA